MQYQTSWNLSKYFYKDLSDPALQKDIETFKEKSEKFIKKYKWKIQKFQTPEELVKFYKDEEDLWKEITKVFHYLFYLQSLDSQNQQVIKKLLEVETLYREIEEKMVFVDEEFKKLLQKEVRRELKGLKRKDDLPTNEEIKFNELVEKVLEQPGLVKDFLENYQLTPLEKEILILVAIKDIDFETQILKQVQDDILQDKNLQWWTKAHLILSELSSALIPYKYHILHKIKTLKYLLSEKEEQLLTKVSSVDSQVENLYDEFHNGLTFPIFLNWKKQILTEEEVRSLRKHIDPKIRRKAYKALRKVYSQREVRVTLSNLYSTFVKNWVLNVKIRNYSNVMEPRNVSEDMENEVVNMLLDQVIENYSLFQKYIQLKAKLLKKKLPLPVEDVLAPINQVDKKISIQDAIKTHLEVMKNFDEDFYEYSLDLLKNGRVDFMPKAGKRWGAYASYSKWQESFVLLNFTEKLDDIFTLTHEFGHAIHGWLSQVQPEQVYDSPLSLAETASIFNEMLLSDYLLNSWNLSKEEKIYLLESKLSDIFATIFRQVQYVDFERQVHQWIYEWKQFSYEDYCKLRRQTQEKMSGKTIKYDVPPQEENSWSMIPHIYHTPFYCYSYAFGNILVFLLFNKYKKEGKKFVQDYKKILSSGGSIPPKQLLAKFGIDINSKEFYQMAFDEIKKMLQELESLI